MSAHADPRTDLARWQRSLLPAGLTDDGEGRRSPGDWVVDLLATALALALGTAVLAATWDDHGETMRVVDVVLGLLSIAALWLRRSYPAAVGVGTNTVASVSGMAGPAGLIALYGVAHRSSWRVVGAVSALSVVASVAYPRIYPGEDSSGVDETGDVGQRRLRVLRALLALAQHADHLAQLLHDRVRGGADHARGLGDLLWRRVRTELERARVQAQKRDAVGEHIVHLARDPAPLGLARLLDVQALLGLQALGALTQREHELAPGAREQPPADDHDRDQQAEQQLQQIAVA